MPIHKKLDPSIPQDKRKLELRNDAVSLMNQIDNNSIKNLTPKRVKADSWSNIMSGLGSKLDKTKYTTFSRYEILDDTMLAQLWIAGGLAHKIVSLKPDDMTREWITIPNDPDKYIENELKRLNVPFHVNLALKWRGLFGGGLNVLGINDGQELTEPVNEKAIKSIDWIKTYDRTDTSITEFHFNNDPKTIGYGDLEFITIHPLYGAPVNVHISRCLIWKGIPVPHRVTTGDFYYWGMSELQKGWNELKNLCASFQHIVNILYELIIGKYGINGFKNLIAENKRKEIEDIMDIIQLSKSTINAVLLDNDDTYSRDTANLSNVGDVLDRFMIMVSAVYGYPVTKLFGRSAAGMNATGEGDEDNYYDSIKAEQPLLMSENLNKLIKYINISLGNKVSEPQIEYNSLYQMTKKEELECKEIQSKIDVNYINTGVISSEEVAENRFGGDGYSYDTKIEMGNRIDIEKEQMREELENLKTQMLNKNNPENIEENN